MRDPRSPGADRLRRIGVQLRSFAQLPGPVRWFYVRALWVASRRRDAYSFEIVTRPDDLRMVLGLAGDARDVVELGTGTGWTTASLVLADPQRRVMSFDPAVHRHRERYLALLPAEARARITLVQEHGRAGPRPGQRVDFLFVDASHELDDTIEHFRRWEGAITPGGTIAFHDYDDPNNPGVTQAIRALELPGAQLGRLFVWRRA
jgi:predicted O-methyltransferase YrrM